MRHTAQKMNCWLALAAIVALYAWLPELHAQLKGSQPTELATSSPAAAQSNLSGSVRVIKLLWNAQPEAAITSLRRAIEIALDRNQLANLIDQLGPLEEMLIAASDQPTNPRYAVSIAALALTGQHSQRAEPLGNLVRNNIDHRLREFLLSVWLSVNNAEAMEFVAQELLAKEGVSSDGQWQHSALLLAFKTNRSHTAQFVLQNWSRLPPAIQLAAIEPLSQQIDSMRQLVSAVNDGTIPKDLVNSNQLRKWLAAGDQKLVDNIARNWGQIRSTDDKQRLEFVKHTIEQLKSTQVAADSGRGWIVFQRVCSQCHVLHGKGFEVGPNITANGRGNFEQLVSNVLDPSLVIGPAFQSRLVVTTDGEVLTGLLIAEDEKRLTLKMQGGKTIELDKKTDIEQLKISEKSLMPEGLELQLSQQELTDLFALLCLVKAPGTVDNETILGTPDSLNKIGRAHV